MARLVSIVSARLVGVVQCLLFALSWSSFAAERQLQRVVMIGRHSVKNPYPTDGSPLESGLLASPMSAYTSRPLPDFGVPPGQLTEQGRRLMRHLGAYHQARYADFLGHLSCNDVAIYADPLSRRDVDSAEEFANGLDASRRCKYSTHGGGSSGADERERLRRIFRDQPDARDVRRGCGTPTIPELSAILGAEPPSVPGLRLYKRQLSMVQERTRCCQQEACGSASKDSICTLFGLPTVMNPNITWRAVGGALGAASQFAEIFAMQHCNGLDAGWGLAEEDMVELLSLLEVPLLQAGMNDVTARNLGSELMSELLRALKLDSAAPKLMVYFGHDTNLHFLQKMLGLRWLSDGWWPNLVEPGAQLIFEVYGENGASAAQSVVRVLKVAASPSQQRRAAQLTMAEPPSVTPLWIPGCGGIFCPMPLFVSIARASMRPECTDSEASAPVGNNLASLTAEAGVGVVVPEATQSQAKPQPSATDGSGVGVVVPEVTARPPVDASADVAEKSIAAPLANPVASFAATLPPVKAPSSSGGPSTSTILFVALCVIGYLAWRYKRKKEAAARGYEILGSSGSQNFML